MYRISKAKWHIKHDLGGILCNNVYFTNNNELCSNEIPYPHICGIDTSLHLYKHIDVFHIKIHKLTAITISLSWFIHKSENMSQRAHTTGGFILFYCVSCLHKNVVKHALFSARSFFLSSFARIFLSPSSFFAFTSLQKVLGFVWLLYCLFFETHFCSCRILNEDKCINSPPHHIKLFYESHESEQK